MIKQMRSSKFTPQTVEQGGDLVQSEKDPPKI